jgi:uncharacterized iron-regulated membrane protein
MKRFKKTILFIHRWLGFISGLVVFIVSITGCIFCFQDEIQDALHNYRKVPVQSVPYAAPSHLKQLALDKFPGATADYIYYFGKDRPAGVLVYTKTQGYIEVFFNPYTATITHTENVKSNFFTVVEYIHLYLLLPAKAGTLVVGISVIVFVALMITGIILWWPKRKTDRKRSFTIKWGARWRRVNYDLHNVLGFYATAIALILALTGLSISFDWVREGLYRSVNLGKSYRAEKILPVSDTSSKSSYNNTVMDRCFQEVLKRSSAQQMFLIGLDERPAGTVGITAYAKSLHYGHSDFYYFDKYSGKLLQSLPYTKKSAGMKLNDLNYDLHVGQALGLFGKIIAFLASLVCASLPITGFILWLGKRKKSKYQKIAANHHNYRVKKLVS